MALWKESTSDSDATSPFDGYQHMYECIDGTHIGGALWQCLETAIPPNVQEDAPNWQRTSYKVWYRDPTTIIANLLANPDFEDQFDTAAYVHVDSDEIRYWGDFMSGNFAWRHSVCLLFLQLTMTLNLFTDYDL